MFSTAAMPSSSALCANIGPAMQSPMAHTPGTFVRNSWSTSMRPRRSVGMPRASRPRPSVYGRRPVATSTVFATSVSASPPADGSTVTDTVSPSTEVPVTFVPRRKSKPCFFRSFWNCFAISRSTPGTMRSRNSTTVTLEPRRPHTEPISRPMTPAPTTTRCSGTAVRSSAPVESTILPAALSTGAGGSGVGSEPVAMMMFLVVSDVLPPSSSSATTLLAPSSRPLPFT
mmetsp:Transcript_18519/g.65518  ORF Transcript_18519/g.65518 Transcript_18519/m.65518 type:complete len:229 (+) Transcript_18519:2586-3272(+)